MRTWRGQASSVRNEPRGGVRWLDALGKSTTGGCQEDHSCPRDRFDLAYNAAHALALAALRWHGFRSENRYTVFQVLPHTLALPLALVRVLSKAHTVRNAAEYEGHLEADQRLVQDMVSARRPSFKAVTALSPLKD